MILLINCLVVIGRRLILQLVDILCGVLLLWRSEYVIRVVMIRQSHLSRKCRTIGCLLNLMLERRILLRPLLHVARYCLSFWPRLGVLLCHLYHSVGFLPTAVALDRIWTALIPYTCL